MRMKRSVFAFTLLWASLSVSAAIDRQALVSRHDVHINKFDEFSPLSVGNGKFVFTADVTGLQTFPEAYAGGIPLTTMAEWGWHSFPNTKNFKLEDTFAMIDTAGRPVPYNSNPKGLAADYLRANPHQISLGLLGLLLTRSDGTKAIQDDIKKIDQQLLLWQGLLISRFEFDGQPVTVQTCVHPQSDTVAVSIQSPLIKENRLAVSLRFPYAAGTWGRDPADWSAPAKHTTERLPAPPLQFAFERSMDQKRYYCRASCSEGAKVSKIDQHEYHFVPYAGYDTFEMAVLFQEAPEFGDNPACDKIQSLAADYWKNFWSTGGAIDLSESDDIRWKELERRIVLSQYLTAIQSGQKYPPAETGLTCNSWFGKFHLEMHWWHSVHFALWDRLPMFERSLNWYNEILPAARQIAQRQGYTGARWPKMTDPSGQDSPSDIGPFLIWQQPHPIYFAELVYAQNPSPETLQKYKDIVLETAEFMASFTRWDDASESFVLGPPLIPAQETYKYAETYNPAFELCYWYWGLETAQKWRTRLGMEIEGRWQNILNNFSLLPERDGIYTAIKPQPYTNTTDHPSMLAALGVLPATPLVDTDTMKKTAQWVFEHWQWDDTWGWDYPMLAMTAARVGLPELAMDALFIESKKNLYWPNGHNYQRENLPLYLPGNGGLLTAVAMMAAGWDGCPDRPAPGFPETGWTVKFENLKKMP